MSEAKKTSDDLDSGTKGRIECRPFLKWAGGKASLLSQLIPRIPHKFNRYYEPFLGGGAVLFRMQPDQATVYDRNAELVNVFEMVKNNPEALIEALRPHVYESDHFYRVRNVDRTPEFADMGAVERAARLIYLNRTCFNGLYRVNSKGHFNVPFGRYQNPLILDETNIRACSKVLARVSLRCSDFTEILTEVTDNDFVYFDPPYYPLNQTSSFAQYTDSGFDSEMHHQLAEVCRELDRRGVRFMLSNSAGAFTEGLYTGFRIERVMAPRAINSKSDKRGNIPELLVRNY